MESVIYTTVPRESGSVFALASCRLYLCHIHVGSEWIQQKFKGIIFPYLGFRVALSRPAGVSQELPCFSQLRLLPVFTIFSLLCQWRPSHITKIDFCSHLSREHVVNRYLRCHFWRKYRLALISDSHSDRYLVTVTLSRMKLLAVFTHFFLTNWHFTPGPYCWQDSTWLFIVWGWLFAQKNIPDKDGFSSFCTIRPYQSPDILIFCFLMCNLDDVMRRIKL